MRDIHPLARGLPPYLDLRSLVNARSIATVTVGVSDSGGAVEAETLGDGDLRESHGVSEVWLLSSSEAEAEFVTESRLRLDGVENLVHNVSLKYFVEG